MRAFLPGSIAEVSSLNGLIGNAIAIIIAFWMRLSVETYPGIRRSQIILPAALTGHGLVLLWFAMTRFPYDRIGLTAGFLLHVLWLYVLYVYADRNVRRRFGIVPYGDTRGLEKIENVDWTVLKRSRKRRE